MLYTIVDNKVVECDYVAQEDRALGNYALCYNDKTKPPIMVNYRDYVPCVENVEELAQGFVVDFYRDRTKNKIYDKEKAIALYEYCKAQDTPCKLYGLIWTYKGATHICEYQGYKVGFVPIK